MIKKIASTWIKQEMLFVADIVALFGEKVCQILPLVQ